VGELGYKPLAGKRVVVTRAVEQSQSLVEALREAGAEPVLLPLVAFAPPDDVAELDACLNNAAQFDWIFFTSQNAVRAVQERCVALGRPLSQALAKVKVAAVGTATAEGARATGLDVTYTSKVHTGVALAEELGSQLAGKRVFLPRSDRANPDLLDTLKRLNAQVTPVVAYKTVAPDADSQRFQQALLQHGVDAILFFSPSAVHHLRELIGAERFRELAGHSVFVAIGPVSEKALQAEGIRRILVAADTTIAASIAVLSEFFTKAGQHQPAGAKQG
jgi:uroporphyrinogen-III synthase